MHLKDTEKIKNIGLTNFDTVHLADLLEEGAPIVSNQVPFLVWWCYFEGCDFICGRRECPCNSYDWPVRCCAIQRSQEDDATN